MQAETSPLSLSASEDLLSVIQSMEAPACWTPVAPGGSTNSERIKVSSPQELRDVKLPEYCCSLGITGSGVWEDEGLPDPIFVSGEDWQLWDAGATRRNLLVFLHRKANVPVSIKLESTTEGEFIGMKCKTSGTITVEWGSDFLSWLPPDQQKLATCSGDVQLDEFAESVVDGTGLLDDDILGRLEYVRASPMRSVKLLLDESKNQWIRESGQAYLQSIRERFTKGAVNLRYGATVGQYYTVVRGPQNNRMLCQDLLRRFVAHGYGGNIRLKYLYVKTIRWEDRERKRKSLKRPVLEELGTLSLENSSVANVKLRIEKCGYVIILDFENDEQIMAFSDTDLYSRAEWISGAE